MAFSSTIEIIDVGTPQSAVNTRGKTYKYVDVAFKGEDGGVEGKKLVDFNNEDVFKAIQNYKKGDVVTVAKDKDKNGYWQWTAVQSGDVGQRTQSGPAPAPSRSAGISAVSGSAAGGRVAGSNYETPEERKIKQRFIIRQSSITNAIELLTNSKGKLAVENVVEVAKQFEDYVYSPVVEEKIADINRLENDIPF